MPDCANLSTCAFFKKYEQDEAMKLALQGFINKYCKGVMQDQCVRKKVSQALGAHNVPVNMMPNGAPITGTTSNDWSEEVKNVLSQKLSVRV
jgi:ribosomal protein L1